MATIKDVVKDSGVSLGTVSKVINGIHVREESYEKVMKSIEKLNYKVNVHARGLKAARTNDIAIILPSLLNPFFTVMLEEVDKELSNRGKRVLLCISENDKEKTVRYLEMAKNNKVDGIFGVTYSDIEKEVTSDMPMVALDRHFQSHIPFVSADNFEGGRLAAKTLSEKGCKELLCFWTGSSDQCEPYKRMTGFQDYCKEHGISHEVLSYIDRNIGDHTAYYNLDLHRELASNMVKEHLQDGRFAFDGIFVSSDHLALTVQDELKKAGLRVPEDVQLIGFDGIRVLNEGKPVVSTIAQPIPLIAKTAVRMLMDLIDKKEVKNITDLPVAFLEGGTTK